MNKATQGYIDLTLAQIGVAVNTVIAKYLLEVFPVSLYLGVRFLATAVVMSIFLKWSHTAIVAPEHPQGKMTARDWRLLWAASLSAGPLFNMLMMMGMRYTTATSAGIVMSTLPAVLALFAFWLLGERLSIRKGVATVLAIGGVVVLSLDSTPGISDDAKGSLLGDFLVFLAVIPEALYSIFVKLLNRRLTPLAIGMIVNWMSALVMLPFAIGALQQTDIVAVPALVWWLIPVTVLCSISFYWLWARGLSQVPGSTAGLFGGVMPVATSIVAVLFLGEIFTRYDGAGMMLVLISIAIGTGVKLHWLFRK